MDDQHAAARPIQERTAAEKFAEQLRALRTAVGNPSFRKMAGRSGRISHTTLHEAAAGTRFPSWETTREFVRACEADEVQWRCRWEDAQRPGAVHAVPDGGVTPTITDSRAGAGLVGAVDTATAGLVTADPAHAVDIPADPVPVVSGVVASSALVPKGRRAPRTAERPQAAGENDVTGPRRHRLPWVAAAAAVLVAMGAVLGVSVRSSPDRSDAMAASPSSAGLVDALIPGDSSQFVADVTVPDGTRVRVNAEFVKVWALANVGSVDWHNRFLARTNPAGDEGGCRVPDRVSISDTAPGEQVLIKVPVTAPNRPGQCRVSWKMVDEQGRVYFPDRRPVYFLVTVTA
jgi:hypothetical protein